MLYWVMEYGKVLIAYIALMYIWPSVVFRKYLAPKSRTYRFAFCATVQVVLVNTVVLLLGLLHILNRWTMVIVFYGIFFGTIFWKKKLSFVWLHELKQVLIGTRGVKLYLSRLIASVKDRIKKMAKQLWGSIKGRRIEYLALAIVVVFGMIYFSYAAFAESSYGCGDMYVHHAWAYGLSQGKIFSGGIYPEAMHCFEYAMSALTGVSLYSCNLFLAGIHVSMLLVSVYCFLKEVMRSRYTGILVLALFLTVDLVSLVEVTSMSRMQWTLPQEFGLYTEFLGALYLVRYLRSERSQRKENGKRKWIVWDENLFIFVMALAGSLAIHFYVTIMAFFLCLAFAIVGIHRIFRNGNFRSLVFGVLIGTLIAVAPMGAAFATGIQFQGSIGWALNIIKGSDTKVEDTQVSTESATQQAENGQQQEEPQTGSVVSTQNESVAGVNSTQVSDVPMEQTEASAIQKIQRVVKGVVHMIADKANIVYEYGYQSAYGQQRAYWIILFTAISAGLGSVCWVIMSLIKRKLILEGYLGTTLASVLFMIVYCSSAVGIPKLLDSVRVCSTEQILILAMMMIPVDFVFAVMGKTILRKILPLVTLLGIGGIYFGTNYLGIYHGYLYTILTRYDAAVEVTNDINRRFPKYSYTIISPTDELYQVIEHGRHEEISNLLKQMQYGAYSIPTEYLFFYVEKEPLLYAQNHFVTGPRWLAEQKYAHFSPAGFTSEGSQVVHSEISKEAAQEAMMSFVKPSDVYSNYTSRNIVESKMYVWCENLKKSFPHEMSVYYEDDAFVCYVIKQNTYRLLNLEE